MKERFRMECPEGCDFFVIIDPVTKEGKAEMLKHMKENHYDNSLPVCEDREVSLNSDRVSSVWMSYTCPLTRMHPGNINCLNIMDRGKCPKGLRR